jgi:hypothetical protein
MNALPSSTYLVRVGPLSALLEVCAVHTVFKQRLETLGLNMYKTSVGKKRPKPRRKTHWPVGKFVLECLNALETLLPQGFIRKVSPYCR